MSGQQAQQQRKPWHQSRMMWAGILALVFGCILTVTFEGQAGDMGAVFLLGGLVCVALWMLRRFFTGR